MATTPILGGVTLPEPYGETQEAAAYRGGSMEMADGSLRHFLVASGLKRTVTLRWRMLTDAEKTTVETAFATLATGSAQLTLPDGRVLTVQRANEGGLVWDWTLTPAGWRYATTMELREL